MKGGNTAVVSHRRRPARLPLIAVLRRATALAGCTALATLAASAACAAGGATPLASSPRLIQVPILMYHRIDLITSQLPPITRRLTVTPTDFARQMTWLRAHGFHTLTESALLAALERRAPLPARPIVITFDDGYRDVLGKAAPTLRRLRMHATAFVITGRISGSDPSFLTWPQLVRLERAGIEIGSHTVTHRELTRLSDAEALQELTASRAALEQHLHHSVPWLAYPAGAEDARVVRLAGQAGYRLAMTTHPGSSQDGNDPLELRRLEILDSTGVAGLAALLGSAGR